MLARTRLMSSSSRSRGGDGFDCSCRAYRSEYRGGDISVRRMQDSSSRIAIGRDNLKFKCHSGIQSR